MSALFNANSDRIISPVYDLPAIGSLSIWIYPNFAYDDSVQHYIYTNTVGSPFSNIFHIHKHSTNNFIAGWFTAATDYRVNTSASALVQSAWNHLLFTWDDTANESKLYLNNAQQGTTITTLATFTGATQVEIGNLPGSNVGFGAGSGGNLAELAIYSVVLTAGDRNSLYKGFSPMLVRPDSLFKYYPLIRNLEYEAIAGGSFTVTSVDVGTHPPMFYPR